MSQQLSAAHRAAIRAGSKAAAKRPERLAHLRRQCKRMNASNRRLSQAERTASARRAALARWERAKAAAA